MAKEHKKLYKAGKNWIVATLTATTITLLGGIGAYTVHADTTIESSQDVQTTSVNQTNQVDNSNDSVTINQPVAVQSSQTAQNDLSVKGNQTNQTVPSSATAAADTSNSDSLDSNIYGTVQSSQNNNSNNSVVLNQPVTMQNNQTAQGNQSVQDSQAAQGNQNASATAADVAAVNNDDGLDPNIYGTVNVKEWDYQINNNILNLTNYLGYLPGYGDDVDDVRPQNGYHIIIPNLNDFNNANINISGIKSVGITSNVLKDIQQNCGSYFQTAVATIAISKTQGAHSDKVVAENSNWDSTFKLPSGETGCLEYVDLTNLDTSKITNIGSLFENQSSLKEVKGIDTWDTSKITNMKCVFNGTMYLKTIGDLSNWDTSNVTDMSFMFSGTDSIDTVGDLSHWNTSKVTSMRSMFGSTALRSVGDLSHWDTGSVTDMSYMFSYTGLRSVGDLSNWNTSKVTNMSGMFESSAISSAGDLGKWDTSNVTDMSEMFSSMFTNIGLRTVGDLSHWNTSNVTDMSDMFQNSCLLEVGDLSHWDTSKVTNMSGMFKDSHLHTLNLGNWNTSNVTDMSDMFQNSYLHEVGNLSNWDTSKLTYPYDMFNGSGLNYFSVSNLGSTTTEFNNKIKVMDDLAIMGQTGATIATIKAPTFYKNISGENQAQIVYETVLPLVRKATDEQYKRFYDNLDAKNKKMFPSRILLERVYPEHLSNPSEVANSIFEIKFPEIQISYVDQNGKVIKTDMISGGVGDKINITLALPDGYELANKDEKIPSTIIVGEDGIKPITIQVKKAPSVQTGSINYIDPDGKVVKTDQVSGKVGDKVDVKLSLPDGYELANKDEQVPSVITVTENGIGTINVNVKKINTTNTGWNQQGDDWLYMQKNGYLAKGWNYLNGHWFYFDLQSGIMKTGIQSIGNSFYYLNAQHDGTYGAMKTGWQFVNGHWIGLQGSGNAYVGWQAINGHWYYFDPQTAYALTNWQDINNHWYYFDPTNAWAQTGWFKSGAGYWYFFDYANAWADTGWQKINNSWYYFDNVNSNALTGWQSINNHWYYFDPTNAWALTGWQWINGHWYWFDQANAWARTGWQYYGGQWYFMDQQNAWMDTGWTTNLSNGQLYYLDKNGHPLTGWQRSLNGFWYYLQPGSDAAAIGWNWINGHWYYFNPEETINGIKAKGAMFTGRHFIDNRWNRFDLNGHWLGYEN